MTDGLSAERRAAYAEAAARLGDRIQAAAGHPRRTEPDDPVARLQPAMYVTTGVAGVDAVLVSGACQTCGKPVPGGGHRDDCRGLMVTGPARQAWEETVMTDDQNLTAEAVVTSAAAISGAGSITATTTTVIWIVLVEDRHTDVEAMPFSSEERAIEVARARAGEWDRDEPDLTDRMVADGWVFLVTYGTEGDCVRVVKRALDDAS